MFNLKNFLANLKELDSDSIKASVEYAESNGGSDVAILCHLVSALVAVIIAMKQVIGKGSMN